MPRGVCFSSSNCRSAPCGAAAELSLPSPSSVLPLPFPLPLPLCGFRWRILHTVVASICLVMPPLGSCCQSKCRSEDPKKISASDFRLKVFIGDLSDLKESAMILQNALSGILMRENKERSHSCWTCSLNLSIVWRLFMSSFMNFLYLLFCSSSHLSIDYRFINLLYILFSSSLHFSIVYYAYI